MHIINLFNPALLLNDESVSKEHQAIIGELLRYRKCISLTDGIIRVTDITKEDDISLTGIDAACLYCHMNRISPHIVNEIDVIDIVKNCDETEVLVDILIMLNEVYKCNDELERMLFSDAPKDIVRRQKRKLQDLVEHLDCNCGCSKPFTDEHGRPLSSLCCIDYKL